MKNMLNYKNILNSSIYKDNYLYNNFYTKKLIHTVQSYTILNNNKYTKFISFNNSYYNKVKKDNDINNYDKIDLKSLYKLEGTLIINNKKHVLIYFNKETINDKLRFHLPNSFVIAGLIIFIAKNPLYISFPAALPIAVFYTFYKVLNYIRRIYDRKNILTRVWYNPFKEELTLILSNNIKKVKKEIDIPINSIYNGNSLKHLSLNYDEFPKSYEEYEKKLNQTLFRYWKKYLTIDKDAIYVKKSPIFCNKRVLIDLLNRKKVELGKNESYLLDENASEVKQIDAIRKLINQTNKIHKQ